MNVDNIIQLAEWVEADPVFIYGSKDTCVCGVILCHARGYNPYNAGEEIIADFLGISREQALSVYGLDNVGGDYRFRRHSYTAAEAGAMLRHLAATGEVDWQAGVRIAAQHTAAIEALKNTAGERPLEAVR